MKIHKHKHVFLVLAFLFILPLLFVGCAGSDGSDGAAGPAGASGPAGPTGSTGPTGSDGNPGTDLTAAAKAETCTLCHKSGGLADIADIHPGLQAMTDYTATIDSVTTAASGTWTRMIVDFTVQDASGNAFPNIKNTNTAGTQFSHLRLGYAKLVPGATATDPHQWVSYTTSDRNPANLSDLGVGMYRYTSTTNIDYDSAVRNRVMLIVYGTAVPQSKNIINDITTGGSVVSREIVTTAACNGCHERLGSTLGTASFHGGARFETQACVVCHTSTLGGGVAEFGPMVHKIHAAKDLDPGDPDWDFTEVTYPQDLKNCTTCHKGTEGGNWFTLPNRAACASCHEIDFASSPTGTAHSGGPQANDNNCSICHPANYDPVAVNYAPVGTVHLTENATDNNPNVETGLVNFGYVISSVTITNSTQPVIKFAILSGMNSAPTTTVVFDLCSSGTKTVMTGYTGGPSFLLGYADGTDTTIDFNNKGKSAAQPGSVSLLNVCDGTKGSMSGPDGSGYYTATLTGEIFPAGSVMRTIALQSYFTQSAGTNSIAANTARHTLSVVKGVTGDTARRAVVDPVKCGGCHEWFEGHGGSRVIGNGTTGTIVCVLCHNPNLTSSGRTVNVALTAQAEKDALTAAGYDVTDALTFPEATNNMKDMIHGIHASHFRTTKYDFVRNRNNGLYYDWSEVTFPGILSNCETCHIPGTYGAVPTGALLTTNLIASDATTTSAVSTLRGTVPNASDKITSPITSTCIMCHDGLLPTTHMETNGGSIKVDRVQ